jgi:hypothetical protein
MVNTKNKPKICGHHFVLNLSPFPDGPRLRSGYPVAMRCSIFHQHCCEMHMNSWEISVEKQAVAGVEKNQAVLPLVKPAEVGDFYFLV